MPITAVMGLIMDSRETPAKQANPANKTASLIFILPVAKGRSWVLFINAS